MTHRRSRSLSGSPEHHRNAAESLYRLARGYASESEENSKRRNCEAAFESLIDAVATDAKAKAHLDEADGYAILSPKSERAEQAFYKACVLRKPLSGLAGLRSRPRRKNRK